MIYSSATLWTSRTTAVEYYIINRIEKETLHSCISSIFSVKWPSEVLKWKNSKVPIKFCRCVFVSFVSLCPLSALFPVQTKQDPAHLVVRSSRSWSFDFRHVLGFYIVSSGRFMMAKPFKRDWTWTWNLKSESEFSFRSMGCYSLQHRLVEYWIKKKIK